MQPAVEVAAGLHGGVLAARLGELGKPRAVHLDGVGEDGEDDVPGAQLVVLGELDGGDGVGDAGDAQEREAGQLVLGQARAGQGFEAGRLVEQSQHPHAVLVVDGHDQVGVAHVMHPRDVLVADALDAVLAEAVLQKRRALQGLGGRHPHLRKLRP